MDKIHFSGIDLNLQTYISSSLINHVYGGVYFVDIKRKIKLWNKGAERITGIKKEDAIGKTCCNNILKHENFEGISLCESHCPLTAAIKNDKHIESRVYLHHKERYKLPVWISVFPVKDEKGNIIGAVESFF